MLALSGSRSARATLSRRLPEGEGLAPRQLDSHFACVTSAGTKSKIQDVKLNPLEQSIREMSKLQAPSFAWRTNGLAMSRKRRGTSPSSTTTKPGRADWRLHPPV